MVDIGDYVNTLAKNRAVEMKFLYADAEQREAYIIRVIVEKELYGDCAKAAQAYASEAHRQQLERSRMSREFASLFTDGKIYRDWKRRYRGSLAGRIKRTK